jgi:VCBS repeat protein/BACON domain-containing protein/S-layer family protein
MTISASQPLAFLSLALIATALIQSSLMSRIDASGEFPSEAQQARLGEQVSIQAAGRGAPWINLSDGRDVVTSFDGDKNLVQSLERNEAQPLALASADFDEDGVPDLVSGYAGATRGIITVHRGNTDSIYPNTAEAKQRREKGTFTESPFLGQAKVMAVAEASDFVGAGDFDADGHWDIVAAKRGGDRLYFFKGDGGGSFAAAEEIHLAGKVSALVTGEVNRRDGLTDIVVAVMTEQGAKALVLEGPDGALNSEPEEIALPDEVTSMALGQVRGDWNIDLAVAAGQELVIIEGRDRKLSQDKEKQATVAAARQDVRAFAQVVNSVAIGDFTGQSDSQLAMLFEDGSVELLSSPAPKGKKNQTTRAVKEWRSELLATERWPKSELVCARLSSNPVENLVVIDRASERLHVLTGSRVQPANIKAARLKKYGKPEPESVSLDVEGGPVAVLPMRLNSDALGDLMIARSTHSAVSIIPSSPVANFIVTNTNPTGAGSLYDAFLNANENPGADLISFNIPGSGPHSIILPFALPTLSEPVTIDGTTQPSFAGSPLIEIRSTQNTFGFQGIQIITGNSVIRGLVISWFDGSEINIVGNGYLVEGNYLGTNIAGSAASLQDAGSGISYGGDNSTIGGTVSAARNIIRGGVALNGSGNSVQGNFLGTDVTGTVGLNPESPPGVVFSGSNNVIGGTTAGAPNVISGNGGASGINGEGVNNLIQGNLIGTDITGTVAIGNLFGISISVSSSSNNTVGGTTPAARNIISASRFYGIYINGGGFGSDTVLIQGNYIGTDINGASDLGNNENGVFIKSSSGFDGETLKVTLGGTTAGARNVISGNDLNGVVITGAVATGCQVQGNYIGTNATGNAAIGNGINGVVITQAPGNTIGGTTPGAPNVISGNGRHGVAIGIDNQPGASNNIVKNNLIGTDATGLSDLGNLKDGMFVNLNSVANRIENNSLAFNKRNGVNVPAFATGNPGIQITIQSNTIFSNTALGIDLGAAGVTANDPNDPDVGANNLQNFPIITSVTFSNGNTHIEGNLNSTPDTDFFLQFFSSNQCVGSNPGQNQQGLNALPILFHTDASGNAPIDITLMVTPVGGWVNCLATDPTGNTSEFSPCVPISLSGGCSFSIAPTSQSFSFNGGAGSVGVTAGAGCSWTAASNDSWISITSGSTGTGSGPVDYSVAPNTSPNSRMGSMTIAGQAFSVSQDGLTCSYSLVPTSQNFVSSGGAGSITVNAPVGCNWTAATNDAWISFTSSVSGSGNGSVNYSVAANSDAARMGTIIIADQSFSVTQDPACSYLIDPGSQSFNDDGGTGFVSVTAGAGCNWTAFENATWVTITSGASGSGTGIVLYTVAANTGPARFTVMTIAAQPFLVTQETGCGFSIAPASKSFTASAGTGTINVSAGAACNWTATSNNPEFITITSGASGGGNGTVGYSVLANTGSSIRSGAITAAGQTFIIYQGINFADVPVSHLFYAEIGKLSARGVTVGCGGGNFCPESIVTREQMAAFILRALGEFSPPAPASQRFADVPPANPFYAFIEQMAVRQITSGCGGGNYCPTNSVLREQMAAFIIRALGEFNPPQPASQRFTDVPPSNSFYAFIDQMAIRGITSGCGGGNYCPTATVTRGQMAAFLVRAFNL